MVPASFPPRIGKRMAKDLYPALPEEERKRLTEDAFADEIDQLLVTAGDMYEKEFRSTEQGERHGIHMETGSGWIYDENGKKQLHVMGFFPWPDSTGRAYILKLVKEKHPALDVSIVSGE